MTRYRRDPSWRAPERADGRGAVVIAGSPLRLFRVSTGGAQVLALAETGEQPPTDTVTRMLDRFVEAGALHPVHEAGPYSPADVTVVVPAFGEIPPLHAGVRIIVVDDGSAPPLQLPPDSPPSVTLTRVEANAGPAAARNAGLDQVTTPLVAFLDTDVQVQDGWLDALLPHFADPRVVLVAPRVCSATGASGLSRYEATHSPLDLGAHPARVAAGTRVSYVPAAALVCRTDVLRAAGGFDADMRVGEDVDLVWRLTELGHRCRYEPESTVHHRPRPTWPALFRQRMGYGRSAAPLAQRHPGALAPVRMSGWSAGVWALVAARRPMWALALAAGTTAALVRKLRHVPPTESVRLATLGHLAAGRQLANAVTRVWWPLALVVAVFVPKSRALLIAAVAAPPGADALRSRSVAPLRDAPLRWADDMAYATGVWQGVLREREPGPLTPGFTTWPRRGDG
ncbi:MAG: mycofactocin biosynthesis glycosyltransferase MftF [Actinobacteria bacterium]|nr:mycofactocin biosynthesis glycosyltransferase MftF [Actinomycetota bacterium]